jgi:hypothetical protein
MYIDLVEKAEGKTQLEKIRCRWGDNIKWLFRKWDIGVWTGLSWLMIETGGGQLRMR